MNMNLPFKNGINMVLNMTTPGAKGDTGATGNSLESISLDEATGDVTVKIENSDAEVIGNINASQTAIYENTITAQETAEAKASEAGTFSDNASASASLAETHATSASGYSEQAGTYATNASNSEANAQAQSEYASGYATTATEQATIATNYANSIIYDIDGGNAQPNTQIILYGGNANG